MHRTSAKKSAEYRNTLASALIASRELLLVMAMHDSGSHVVKAFFEVEDEMSAQVQSILLSEKTRLSTSKAGKKLLSELQVQRH